MARASFKMPEDFLLKVSKLNEKTDDILPNAQTEEVRLSIFTKGNYIGLRNQLTNLLLEVDFSITDRRYIGFEDDTKYHHYAIDVMKEYEMEV